MAAPAVATRLTPAGIMMEEGFPSKICFERDTNVSFWESSITPPGIDNGEAINTTTHFNTGYRTKAARYLKELTDGSVKAGYDPNVINDIIALVGRNGAITITFPDLTTLVFWGYLKSWVPNELADGVHPECTIVVVVTNWDPVNRVEAGPVLTQVAGT